MQFSLGMLVLTLCMSVSQSYKVQLSCQREVTACYHRLKSKHPDLQDDSILTHCLLTSDTK
jgi:hypothetical protein